MSSKNDSTKFGRHFNLEFYRFVKTKKNVGIENKKLIDEINLSYGEFFWI